MRYVIYGAGAVGGTIGARLAERGHEVAFIARGAHLEAIQRHGLTLDAPGATVTQAIPSFANPAEIDWRADDVVLLSMKTQDTPAALEALRGAAGPGVPVVCAQNGVANERMALRLFERVYGMLVILPATHLQPGVVVADSAPITGILDVGCYPSGRDSLTEDIAADLARATFVADPSDAIMRWKYAKLLTNLGNGLQAVCGPDAATADIRQLLVDEGVAAYRAAGVDWVPSAEFEARRSPRITLNPDRPRAGSSTWQSLERGTGSLESDYLNGEIALLGRLHGVPTQANALIQDLSAEAARTRARPGSVSADTVRARLGLTRA